MEKEIFHRSRRARKEEGKEKVQNKGQADNVFLNLFLTGLTGLFFILQIRNYYYSFVPELELGNKEANDKHLLF